MNVTLKKPIFANKVLAPTSKSAAHRVLIAAAFADAPTRIRVSGAGADIAATVRCLSSMGAKIEEKKCEDGNCWLCVTPIQEGVENAIADCGESGSTLRFLVPVAGAIGKKTTFLRRGRLPERPMEPLASELMRHGVNLTENEDGSLTVSGKLEAGDYAIAANVSSQFVTGLLFALSLLDKPSTLRLTGEIESAPYIEMTLNALGAFGARPEESVNEPVYCVGGKRLVTPGELYPEGDFSGAAFPLAAGVLGANPVTVGGMDLSSAQGDKAIVELLEKFGAKIEKDPKRGEITAFPSNLCGIHIDAKQIPDLVPILAVLGAFAKGKTVITGAARLRLKESDRIATTAALLRALGGKVEESDDGLTVYGSPLTGGKVDGANDHRIVMSAAVAALRIDDEVEITDSEAVAKSYPEFFTLLK